MMPTPPRTPTARKSLPGTPSAPTPNAPSLNSPIVVQKRRWQGDNVSLPLQGLTQPANVDESALVAQMASSKRQKLGHEMDMESQYLVMPTSPSRNPSSAQNPAAYPAQSYQSSQRPFNEWPQKVFSAAIKGNRDLLSGNPAINPVNSQRIDNISHAMWQVVFNHENMMRDVTAKVAMFSTMKLRALARLNYLPSWWYMREMACGVMSSQGWITDDSEMQSLWVETVEWCARVETKMGIQGEGTAVPKHEDADVA